MELFIIAFLIILNGIFSMSEIAIVSARKSRLEAEAKRGNKNAKAALDTANDPNRFLSTVQIGITLIGILTGIFSGDKITTDISSFVQQFDLFRPYADSIAVAIVVTILTFFSLVIGELVPKRIGLSNPEILAKLVARPMRTLSVIASPFVWLLTVTSDFLIRLFKIKKSTSSKITEEEIKAIIQVGTADGAIQEIEQDIVERVFNLGDRKVSSLMTHRSDTIFLKTQFNAGEVRETVLKNLHSVYPVKNENGEVQGIVLLKELFRSIDDQNFDLTQLLQSPNYITENISSYEALIQFKKSNIHHAIVIDEYGQMQGIITMNDLIEPLVGDVSEFYGTEYYFIQRDDGSWLVDGQFPFSEFLHKFDLAELINDYPFDTLSGLIFHQLRKVPAAGDKFRWLIFNIEIVDMDGVRIDKVLVNLVNEDQ